MDNIKAITKKRHQMFGRSTSDKEFANRKTRLKVLVDEYGHEAVSAASGLSVSSLTTYLRTKYPKLAETSLRQAEVILAQM